MEIDTLNPILARYRHLRRINTRHQTDALTFVSTSAMLAHAKRLGLTSGKTIVAEEDECHFIFDLAVYTAQPGRSRAIDRYARAFVGAQGTDETIVLKAMQSATFSIWRVERRHEKEGLIVRDLVREEEVWLMDEGLNTTAPIGLCFGGRLFGVPGEFGMTCGVVTTVNAALLNFLFDACECLFDRSPHEVAEDRRFATALYNLALENGFDDEIGRDAA